VAALAGERRVTVPAGIYERKCIRKIIVKASVISA
jgi:hypothetical protein